MTTDTDPLVSTTDTAANGEPAVPIQARRRALIVGGAVIIGLLAALLLARYAANGAGLDWVEQWLTEIRDAPYALFVVIAVYVTLSFAAAPQFGLHAACAIVFGSVLGFVYAWIATMTGALLHFYLGDRFGSRALQRYGGTRTNVFSRKLGDHGILASALVRLVPSAPFIVINVAAGVSHIPFWKFLLGTGLGTTPKIALIAFVGGSIMDVIQDQRPQDIALVVAGIVLWLLLGFVAKRYLVPYLRRPSPADDATTPNDADAGHQPDRQP